MRRQRRDKTLRPALVSIAEIIAALDHAGVQLSAEDVSRAAEWVCACARAGADAAMEDLRSGRAGTGGYPEDYFKKALGEEQ